MNKSDPLDLRLIKMIIESIHEDVVEAIAAKGKTITKHLRALRKPWSVLRGYCGRFRRV